ncbi:MAG: glutamine amidotransferase [Actinomyces sp.]|uniref:type 1 glutamine amidotransferase n=1 Tax=Actinomyces sp. TaxID=29317 RepID=UPI0026DD6071|nr:glutamine amidotransferase [Actinomyces sp.]MDO4243846.1 glutamine amidotransferase [Actinomyces sp.]
MSSTNGTGGTGGAGGTGQTHGGVWEHTTQGPARGRLRVLQLYPRDMNIYGDWGNTLVLVRRAQWQGYDVELLSYDPGDELPRDVHLVVGGGGQDSGQSRIKDDLSSRAGELRAWAADGVPMLVICGLYQLFGHRFATGTGSVIPGIGVIDAETVAGDGRLIGNITLDAGALGQVVGYENHSGLTTLGPGAKPFGRVLSGNGNNGTDSTEGARVHHLIGTYLHGSLLPKNPVVADWLLARAVEHAGGAWDPAPLEDPVDAWADKARAVAMSRPR